MVQSQTYHTGINACILCPTIILFTSTVVTKDCSSKIMYFCADYPEFCFMLVNLVQKRCISIVVSKTKQMLC